MHFLIVEDNSSDLKLLLRQLKKAYPGYTHHAVKNEVEFRQHLLSGTKIDVILSDYNLPEFKGTDAYHLLGELEQDIPFILITGTLEDKVAAELVDIGLDDYMLKDRLSRLSVSVDAAIERHKLRTENKRSYAELQASEEKFSSLASVAPVGIFRTDAQANCTYVNAKYCKLTGLTEQEAMGRGWLKAVHPSDVDRLNTTWQKVLKVDSRIDVEYRLLRKGSEVVWVLGQVKRELDPEGNIIGTVGTLTDITELKQKDVSLQRIQTAVNASSDHIFIIDPESLKFIGFNETARAELGYSAEEMKNMGPQNLIPDVTESDARGLIASVLQLGKFQMETKHKRKSGEPMDVEASLTVFNEEGRQLVVASVRDISERKKSNEEIRKLSAVVREIENGVVISDANERITWVNAGFEKQTGYSFEEVRGKVASQFLQKQNGQGEINQTVKKGISSQEPFSAELINYHKNGKPFWISLSVTPMLGADGKVEQFIGVSTDISERVRYQREFTSKLESEVKQRTADLIESNRLLDERNRETQESIRYAERLQRAVLPEISAFTDGLRDAFVFFKPKDIVSGDFYWVSEGENCTVVVCADCTGHGVPGAFMSMMGIELLNKIVNDQGIRQPAQIMNYLDDGLQKTLQKAGDFSLGDGMDIAICRVYKDKQEIVFAGAGRPIIHISNGDLKKYKNGRFGLGGSFRRKVVSSYTEDTISYNPNDLLYLFSDGYADQFGGDDGRKLMSKQFSQLISEAATLPIKNQHAKIEQFFAQWKGTHKQVDDVLVMGIQL